MVKNETLIQVVSLWVQHYKLVRYVHPLSIMFPNRPIHYCSYMLKGQNVKQQYIVVILQKLLIIRAKTIHIRAQTRRNRTHQAMENITSSLKLSGQQAN